LEEETFKKRKFLSALCSQDDSVKWAAVTAMGIYVSELAEKNLEAARNWMRRFMWQLNEESGNIGWGIPEVMGEVMARHEGIAQEFAPILVSYIREDGNFLEYEPLQRGAVWGIGRLAQVRPQILESLHVSLYLLPFLRSPDATVRGLSVYVAALMDAKEAEGLLERLMNDDTPFQTYLNGAIVTVHIHEFARKAWDRIQKRKDSPSKKNGVRS
jgi:hypothetical protein